MLLGEQRLRDALAGCDLAGVPAARLMELQLRYHAALREEFVETRPLPNRELARLRSLAA